MYYDATIATGDDDTEGRCYCPTGYNGTQRRIALIESCTKELLNSTACACIERDSTSHKQSLKVSSYIYIYIYI